MCYKVKFEGHKDGGTETISRSVLCSAARENKLQWLPKL